MRAIRGMRGMGAMKAMARGSASRSIGGGHTGKRMHWSSITRVRHRFPRCFYFCWFKYIRGWINWYEFLRCLCDCFERYGLPKPWWCYWLRGGFGGNAKAFPMSKA